MADNSKFVQITSNAVISEGGTIVRELFALDEEGNVWTYRFSLKGGEIERWERLKTDRK
jgi:hypothetical protein